MKRKYMLEMGERESDCVNWHGGHFLVLLTTSNLGLESCPFLIAVLVLSDRAHILIAVLGLIGSHARN